MNRQGMVKRVAGEVQMTRDAAEPAVRTVFWAVGETLARGKIIAITGFGRFAWKSRPAHQGQNPRTGESIVNAVSNAVSFRAGKALREAVS